MNDDRYCYPYPPQTYPSLRDACHGGGGGGGDGGDGDGEGRAMGIVDRYGHRRCLL